MSLGHDFTGFASAGAYGVGNGRHLPAGPLRESLAQAFKRVHALVVVGEDCQHLVGRTSLPALPASITPNADFNIKEAGPLLAFAGLARPQKFFDTLRSLGANLVATRSFADHHAYHAHELKQLHDEAAAFGARLITTEKDVGIPLVVSVEGRPKFHAQAGAFKGRKAIQVVGLITS